MTALLRIKREKVVNPGDEMLVTALRDIEIFSLEIAETTERNLYKGKLLDMDSSVVLTTPEIDFSSCKEKIYQMIISLGKLISAEVKSPKINIKPLLKESLEPKPNLKLLGENIYNYSNI